VEARGGGGGCVVNRYKLYYRVAVAGWQWEERIGEVIASILSGDKLKIGAFCYMIPRGSEHFLQKKLNARGGGCVRICVIECYQVAVAGWQWCGCVFGVIASILSGDKLKIGAFWAFLHRFLPDFRLFLLNNLLSGLKKSGSGRVAVWKSTFKTAIRTQKTLYLIIFDVFPCILPPKSTQIATFYM
jgi:hypothetical protein